MKRSYHFRSLVLHGFAMLVPALCVAQVHATVLFTTNPTSDPTTPAAVNSAQFYRYDADAASDDASPVRYSLSYGPAGMQVDASTGMVSWFAGAPGSYSVGIRAEMLNDPDQSVTQEWSVVASMPSSATVSTNPLPFTGACVGSTISVEYTALGTFAAGNAFILQLSDANGSFDNFLNIGSIISTTSDTIHAKLPDNIPVGSGYRVRVMSSNPVSIGSDNGSDFSITQYPDADMVVTGGLVATGKGNLTFVGSAITFLDSLGQSASYLWNFGEGASPATSDQPDPDPVTYSTSGNKVVTLTVTSAGGCSNTYTYRLTTVATVPVIDSKAAIAYDGNIIPAVSAGKDTTMWICPGGTFDNSTYPHTITEIFAETGANVVLHHRYREEVVYLKNGASLNIVGISTPLIIVYEPGASIQGDSNSNISLMPVASLAFDYTDAPVNGCPSLAPYGRVIADGTPEIRDTRLFNESGKDYWVHGSGTLESSGDGNTYITDPGAHVIATGNNCTVYLKGGATFEARGGGGHRIIYETSAVIVNAGDGSGLFPSSGITYTYQGSVVSGVSAETVREDDRRIEMMPNPASTKVEIRNDSYRGMVSSIEMHNATGQLVREQKVSLHEGESIQLSLDGLAPGIYYVRLHGGSETLVRKLIVR